MIGNQEIRKKPYLSISFSGDMIVNLSGQRLLMASIRPTRMVG
jgi:hypothetical protein